MRNYLVVLVGRASEADAIRDLGTVINHYPTTTTADLFITRYQPIRKPGNWRYMAVARVSVDALEVPPLLPDMQLIAAD